MSYRLVMIVLLTVATQAQAKEGNLEFAISKEKINNLNDEDFTTREAASKALTEWAVRHPKESSVVLCNYYFQVESPESRARLEHILRMLYFNRSKPVLGISFKEKLIKLGNGQAVRGMHVTRVITAKSAHKGGIKRGDDIVWIGKNIPVKVNEVLTPKANISSLVVGVKVPFHIIRKGQILVLKIRVEGKPIINTTTENKEKNEVLFYQWLENQKKLRKNTSEN